MIYDKIFLVNSANVPIDTSLNTYIRTYAKLTGTKFMCLEGGCGACIVTLTGRHPVSGKQMSWAVNSVGENKIFYFFRFILNYRHISISFSVFGLFILVMA